MVLNSHIEYPVFRAGGLFVGAVADPADYCCISLGRKGITVRCSHYFVRFVFPPVIELAGRRDREHGKDRLFSVRHPDHGLFVSFHIQIRHLKLLQADRYIIIVFIFRMSQFCCQIIGHSHVEISLYAVPLSPIIRDLMIVSVIDR